MKLYKVINKNNQAKDGGDFDYTPYLPKSNKKGKWLPRIKNVVECEKGYHITPFWNMFLDSEEDKIYEVEVKGLQEKKNEIGVIEKYVCESIRLVKKIKVVFDNNGNIGNCNSGDRNSGDRNTGNCNTGYCNSGNWNTGYRNSGNWNSGNWNTGYCNSGDRNTGNWNTCDFETGFFNTKQSKTIRVFNVEILRTVWEETEMPQFIYFNSGKDYKKSFQASFNKIVDKKEIDLLLNLPNFDYKVFEEISGISKKMIEKKRRKL